MNIQEIQIKEFPIIIFSDSHTNISNIRELQRLYPNKPLISLGDLTFLFSKPGETWNHKSIDFFAEHKIPCVVGNHDQHLLNCSTGNSLTKALNRFDEYSSFDADIYDLTQQHIDYLRKLPIGIKLILPNNKHYFLCHNKVRDLWGNIEESYKEFAFIKEFPINNDTIACLRGHEHREFIIDFPNVSTKLITIGHLCNGDHHNTENKGKKYAIITENGVEFKQL